MLVIGSGVEGDAGSAVSVAGSEGDRAVPAPVVGSDVGELYRTLSRQLERIVRVGVRAPEPVIEDACQFAWTRLVHHRGRVRRDTALGWLVRTAIREAVKLIGHGTRELSLDADVEAQTAIHRADPMPGPSVICEQRERLRALTALTARQQRLLWLYGLGLTYDEMAVHDGCSPRTVERQLKRARASLRAREQ